MMRNLIVLASVLVAASHMGCSARSGSSGPPSSSSTTSDPRPCARNLTSDGGFWTGRTFRSFADFDAVDKESAFRRVAAAVVSEGYQVTNTDKDLGMISASQTVSYGKGKTVPLNPLVKARSGGGVRVEVLFQMSGGLSVSEDSVRKSFCNIIEAAAQ